MKLRTTLTAALAALLVAAPGASAHITLASNATAAGGYAALTLGVPHGCDGAPSDKLILQIPDGVTSFTPGRTAFWTPVMTMKTLDEPITSAHGDKISEVPDTVTWTATKPLPDGQLDQIPASIRLPDAAGQLNFPIVQECVGAAETAWTQIATPDGDEPERPAPSILVTEAAGDEHGGGDADEHADDASDSDDDSSAKEVGELEDDVDTARTTAYVGIALGALGLLFGLVAMLRRKR